MEYIDSNTIKATIPPGFQPGTYNLHVTNPGGGHKILYNAFTIAPINIPLLAGLNILGLPQEYNSFDLILSLGSYDEILKIQR